MEMLRRGKESGLDTIVLLRKIKKTKKAFPHCLFASPSLLDSANTRLGGNLRVYRSA